MRYAIIPLTVGKNDHSCFGGTIDMLALEISLLVVGVLLTASILSQSGKDKNLSGSIAGGAETFLGKAKGKALDKFLNKANIVLSSVFGILALVTYLLHS